MHFHRVCQRAACEQFVNSQGLRPYNRSRFQACLTFTPAKGFIRLSSPAGLSPSYPLTTFQISQTSPARQEPCQNCHSQQGFRPLIHSRVPCIPSLHRSVTPLFTACSLRTPPAAFAHFYSFHQGIPPFSLHPGAQKPPPKKAGAAYRSIFLFTPRGSESPLRGQLLPIP